MVAWFIIAIATLAVFAFIAVNGVQTVAATTDGVGRIETARRMDAAVSAIIARSGSPNNSGRMMVMAGTTVDGIYGLPPELAMYATTPFGQRMTYCPFGDNETGTSTGAVPIGGGNSYQINLGADATGRTYVLGGRPNLPQVAENTNLMGYLMAPRTKTSATPVCSTVRFNTSTRRFEAPDSFVKPIIRSSSGEEQRQQAGREVIYYVSPNGSGRGLAPNDPTTIYAAATYYKTNLPQAMRIVLSAGNHMLPAQYLNATTGGFSDKGNAGTLILDGQPGAQLDFSGPSDIWVPGNLEVRNLTIVTTAGLWAEQGRKLTLNNTSTGRLYINGGGTLTATNVTVTNGQSTDADIWIGAGSSATFTGAVNVNTVAGKHGIYTTGGGKAAFDLATINLSAIGGGTIAYGLFTDDGSEMNFRNTALVINAVTTWPILVFGRNSWTGSTVTSNVSNRSMFELQHGGYLSLIEGSYGLGVPPGLGIIDLGASGFSGNARVRASSACWTTAAAVGVQFARSALGNASNQTSVVEDDERPLDMNPNPTSAQVVANGEAMARNTQRAQLRNTNTSAFTCQIG